MLRFRSFRFYKLSNPSIKNGGLFGDDKMSAYQILPPESYPKTILIEKDQMYDFELLMKENGLNFPIIAKPDIGCRGVLVQKIENLADLFKYSAIANQNFLLQEFCTLPHEIGLFYCRLPHESKGKITGITIKNFLTITGDGFSSLNELLLQNPRHALQISKLKMQMNLDEVLNVSEKQCLVPYGNHNRGTEFLDGEALITPALEAFFDRLLGQIDGLYYGRFDIRYNSLEELEQGKNFSIIEYNGVKSEPTHIYDPKHSFWFGQKEIFRHQAILYKIILSQFYFNGTKL
jgi:hypothetical protein